MMTRTLLLLVIVIPMMVVTIAGFTWLQIYLSKKEHWLPGLILPMVVFLGSLLVFGGLGAYTSIISSGVNNEAFVVAYTRETRIQMWLHGITVLLMFNLPNIPLLIIYALQRKKKKSLVEIDQMSIRDL